MTPHTSGRKLLLSGALALLAMLAVKPAQAQVSFGVDVASRYIWRGIDFGQALSFQPGFSYASGSFEVGAWGAYSNTGGGANELDLYASYSIALGESSSLSIGVTDYYYPSAPGSFLTFDNDGDHVIEPFVSYSGAFTLSAYMNVMNDPDNTVYLNAAFPFTVDDVEMTFSLGVVPQESAWYGTSGAAIQDIGISASREIKITESFSLPVFSSYIVNPHQEVSFLLFGLSL